MQIIIEAVEHAPQLEEAMALVRRVFMAFEAPEYPPEGVEAFLDYIAMPGVQTLVDQGRLTVWSAQHATELVGVVAMRPPCQISLLFVDPAYHRQGIAKRLLAHALAAYRKDGEPVTVHASPYALEAYRRMGFTETGPEQSSSGIRFIPMVFKG